MRRAATLISVLAGVALLGAACGRAGDRQSAREDVEGGPVAVSNTCVQTYSPDTLIERSFAFDGTVASIELRTDSHLPDGENEVPWVTFVVNQWFRAGSAPRIGVWMDSLNIETSAGTIEAEPGARLLVAGEPRWGGDPLEDPIAWACGFTQPWTPEAAAEWQAAFDSSPKDAAAPMSTPPATPTSSDRNVVEALVSFARSGGRAKAKAPPFARDGIWLGLADRLLVMRSATELTDPKVWELDGEVFRAYVGPFSALEFWRDRNRPSSRSVLTLTVCRRRCRLRLRWPTCAD
jgi:hypothetical protein